MFKTISTKVDEKTGIGTIRFELPDQRNAMTVEMAEEFRGAVLNLADHSGVRCLILTGNGSSFCAGGDLAHLAQQTQWCAERNRRHMRSFYDAFLSIIDFPYPTIAAINGPAIGAGLCVALACDLRYAAHSSSLGATYINLGLFPGMGATHLLPYHIGHARAAEMMLTGKVLKAKEAFQIGLVNEVFEDEQFHDLVQSVAHRISKKSDSSLRMLKQVLSRSMSAGIDKSLDFEALAQTISFGSDEMILALSKYKEVQ